MTDTTTLRDIITFLDDEADNRAAAGSEMSDYTREPRELAEKLRAWLAIDRTARLEVDHTAPRVVALTTLDEKALARIAELLASPSVGPIPWLHSENEPGEIEVDEPEPQQRYAIGKFWGGPTEWVDRSELVVLLVNNAAALLAENAALRARVEEMDRAEVVWRWNSQALEAKVKELEGERDEALKLLLTRYVTPDLVKLVGHALRDLEHEIETVCRLRGETDADTDLKRFVHYVDHADSLSRGEVSRIIDFAQGQMVRAQAALSTLAEVGREELEALASDHLRLRFTEARDGERLPYVSGVDAFLDAVLALFHRPVSTGGDGK